MLDTMPGLKELELTCKPDAVFMISSVKSMSLAKVMLKELVVRTEVGFLTFEKVITPTFEVDPYCTSHALI
jgi:hypothetical protein